MKMNDQKTDREVDYHAVMDLADRIKELNNQFKDKIGILIRDLDPSVKSIHQVDCLQLIADLACSSHSLSLLEEKQVPQKLITLLKLEDPLIVPHALKLFYRVNTVDFETKYPQVLDKVCDYCQSNNKQLIGYAIDLIAAIGRGGYRARKVLDNHPQFRQICLPQLGSITMNSDIPLKIRALKCIGDLLKIHPRDPINESKKLCENQYLAMMEGKGRMTNQLLTLCRDSVLKIRIISMSVVANMVEQHWGRKELAEQSHFQQWILDCSTEVCTEEKEAKLKIIRTLNRTRVTSCPSSRKKAIER